MPESSRGGRAARRRAAILTCAAPVERRVAESHALLEEVTRRGCRLVCEPIRDANVDRTDDDRGGVHRALELVDRAAIDVLLVADLRRRGRSVAELARVVGRLQTHHVTLVSLREAIDLSTNSGRDFVTALFTVAEFEASCLRDRTSAGLAAAAARGRAVGQAPYGLRWQLAADSDAPAGLVPVPEEIETLRRAIELHRHLGKWDAVVYALTTESRSSRTGKPWQRDVLARATRNRRVAALLRGQPGGVPTS